MPRPTSGDITLFQPVLQRAVDAGARLRQQVNEALHDDTLSNDERLRRIGQARRDFATTCRRIDLDLIDATNTFGSRST